MPDSFLFALNLSDEPRFGVMLDDVTTCVMEQIGYSSPAVAETLAKLRLARQAGVDQGRRECEIQFRTEAGQLIIVLSYAGGREWRLSRALPD